MSGECLQISKHVDNIHDQCSGVCSGLFQIVEANPSIRGYKEHSGNVDGECRRNSNAESGDEEIVSPVSYVLFCYEAIS